MDLTIKVDNDIEIISLITKVNLVNKVNPNLLLQYYEYNNFNKFDIFERLFDLILLNKGNILINTFLKIYKSNKIDNYNNFRDSLRLINSLYNNMEIYTAIRECETFNNVEFIDYFKNYILGSESDAMSSNIKYSRFLSHTARNELNALFGVSNFKINRNNLFSSGNLLLYIKINNLMKDSNIKLNNAEKLFINTINSAAINSIVSNKYDNLRYIKKDFIGFRGYYNVDLEVVYTFLNYFETFYTDFYNKLKISEEQYNACCKFKDKFTKLYMNENI